MTTLLIIAGLFIIFGYVMVLRIKGLDFKRRQDIMHEDQRSQNILMQNKLDLIHMLVNGAMTAAMEGELDANMRDVASMREVIDLKRANGQEPTLLALEAVFNMDKRIEELRSAIKARHEAALADRIYITPAVVAQSAEASDLNPE